MGENGRTVPIRFGNRTSSKNKNNLIPHFPTHLHVQIAHRALPVYALPPPLCVSCLLISLFVCFVAPDKAITPHARTLLRSISNSAGAINSSQNLIINCFHWSRSDITNAYYCARTPAPWGGDNVNFNPCWVFSSLRFVQNLIGCE